MERQTTNFKQLKCLGFEFWGPWKWSADVEIYSSVFSLGNYFVFWTFEEREIASITQTLKDIYSFCTSFTWRKLGHKKCLSVSTTYFLLHSMSSITSENFWHQIHCWGQGNDPAPLCCAHCSCSPGAVDKVWSAPEQGCPPWPYSHSMGEISKELICLLPPATSCKTTQNADSFCVLLQQLHIYY